LPHTQPFPPSTADPSNPSGHNIYVNPFRELLAEEEKVEAEAQALRERECKAAEPEGQLAGTWFTDPRRAVQAPGAAASPLPARVAHSTTSVGAYIKPAAKAAAKKQVAPAGNDFDAW